MRQFFPVKDQNVIPIPKKSNFKHVNLNLLPIILDLISYFITQNLSGLFTQNTYENGHAKVAVRLPSGFQTFLYDLHFSKV